MIEGKPHFAIVAGEASGDLLGSNLIKSLKSIYPDATFTGIGGESMLKEGFQSLFPMERLSVMGFVEPLKRLPEILHIRKKLIENFTAHKPTLFIGIDSPDFNLNLALKLKQSGIKTVHYVSPTIWAWRSGRIHKIKKAIDLMLTLFPFETQIYNHHQVEAVCVGHPLADEIPMNSDKNAAREALGLKPNELTVALLPGSRKQELNYMAPEFIKVAKIIHEKNPHVKFITATANKARLQQWQQIQSAMQDTLISNYPKRATEVMAASDVILLTSGTASLQAMLVKRPTLIAYKTSKFVFWLAKKLVKVRFIGMPNILANECVMPEYIQEQMDAKTMASQILSFLTSASNQQLYDKFTQLHLSLKKDTSEILSRTLHKLIKG